MASGLLNTTSKALLDSLLGSGAGSTWPSTVWIGLSIADPGVDGSGAAEPVGNGYARTSSAKLSDWSAATDGASGKVEKTHTTSITFPQAVGGDWGTASHFLIWDSGPGAGGNLLCWAPLDTPVPINNGDDQRFNPGGLKIRLSNVA